MFRPHLISHPQGVLFDIRSVRFNLSIRVFTKNDINNAVVHYDAPFPLFYRLIQVITCFTKVIKYFSEGMNLN